MPNFIPVTYSGDGRIINATNAANGVAVNFYIELGKAGFKHAFLSLAIVATTVQLFATADGPSVADADATWVNVTNTLFGVSQITTSGEWHINTPESFDRLRLTYTPSNATNSLAVRLTRMG
jgi:hypothetical protein